MIHNIRFRLFIYENEDPEELILALHNIYQLQNMK